MFDVSGYIAAVKKHWLLFLLTLFVVVLFLSGPFYAAYRFARAKLPGGSALPAK